MYQLTNFYYFLIFCLSLIPNRYVQSNNVKIGFIESKNSQYDSPKKDFSEKILRYLEKELLNINIAIIAPSSGGFEKELQHIRDSKINLQIPGDLVLHKNQRSEFKNLNLANTTVYRIEHLTSILHDPNIDIIWCWRGGYGLSMLMHELLKIKKPEKEKIIIGYSDITLLHLLLCKWGWHSIHGPMVMEIFKYGKNFDNFCKLVALLKQQKRCSLTDLQPLNTAATKVYMITGKITGGNLTMVQNSLGTPFSVISHDHILFLEEINSEGYQIQRALDHLKNAGVFKNAKAIILGNFDSKDKFVNQMLQEYAKRIKIPIYKTNQIGHNRHNFPLQYNTTYSIEICKRERSYVSTTKNSRLPVYALNPK